eukprot:237235-Heterocapsa_arctica.AAC.1
MAVPEGLVAHFDLEAARHRPCQAEEVVGLHAGPEAEGGVRVHARDVAAYLDLDVVADTMALGRGRA